MPQALCQTPVKQLWEDPNSEEIMRLYAQYYLPTLKILRLLTQVFSHRAEMWECIAKKLALPWYQVETRFWQIFRERPNLLENNKSNLLLDHYKHKAGRVVLTSTPRNPLDLCTPPTELGQQPSRKRHISNPGYNGMRKRRRHATWNEIDGAEQSEVEYQTK